MKLSPAVDLGRSLHLLFGNRPGAEATIRRDAARQSCTAQAILDRFLLTAGDDRREIVLLADEVGLGKTYVALTVAVSLLDAIRRGEAPDGFPSNKPAVLILTPDNDALFNKWLREAGSFRSDCAAHPGELESWLKILPSTGECGNVPELTAAIREATRSRPALLIARMGAFGKPLQYRDYWRRLGLACVFQRLGIDLDGRRRCCRIVLGTWSQENVGELLDLRRAGSLWSWEGSDNFSSDVRRAYERAVEDASHLQEIRAAIDAEDGDRLTRALDWLTRAALTWDWPTLPLVIIDEVHNLKNPWTAMRQNLEYCLRGRATRVLGLSATPFQLRHDELLRVLDLRSLLSLGRERADELDAHVKMLAQSMTAARSAGDRFRDRWGVLRPGDRSAAHTHWQEFEGSPRQEWLRQATDLQPPRLSRAFQSAVELETSNRQLESALRPFVIRHRHQRDYRSHFVGRNVRSEASEGGRDFSWAPGLEVGGPSELVHYLLMRAVYLAKEQKGLPGLGAELTGSYRHLVETSAIWRKLATVSNNELRAYRSVLEPMLSREADRDHAKIAATVERARDWFRHGRKTLIFCVYIKTAEAVRDEVQRAIEADLQEQWDRVFGDARQFDNFRKRFFNHREPLYALIQDHPLLGSLPGDGAVGVEESIRLGEEHLQQVAALLLERGELPDVEKPDRRLLLAAVEQVAVSAWQESEEGRAWLGAVLRQSRELTDHILAPAWLDGRSALLRLGNRPRRGEERDAEFGEEREETVTSRTGRRLGDAERADLAERWVQRLRHESLGELLAPYFRAGLLPQGPLPLLPRYHACLLCGLRLGSRVVVGQVFRRMLKAEEFLIRYLADAPRDRAEQWAEYLSRRYGEPLHGHHESLRDRVTAYLETLVRAQSNDKLAEGYHAAASNRNVVQFVRGGMPDRDRYFLGFNTPYRPEILITTEVGQEGIDLHRECRHVIHHDLCWNPASIEQRTGRVDRIGSKVERERASEMRDNGDAGGDQLPALDVVVPYLAATYDERMFEELYRRAQLFEVTMGGDFHVEGRVDLDDLEAERRRRQEEGIGTDEEDLGQEGNTGAVDLPPGMVHRLRIDLSVWTGEAVQGAARPEPTSMNP